MGARLQIPSREVAWIFNGTTIKAGPQKGPCERSLKREPADVLNEDRVLGKVPTPTRPPDFGLEEKDAYRLCIPEIGHNLTGPSGLEVWE
jgi:hypothetical protein